jgi:hypothetical protein
MPRPKTSRFLPPEGKLRFPRFLRQKPSALARCLTGGGNKLPVPPGENAGCSFTLLAVCGENKRDC